MTFGELCPSAFFNSDHVASCVDESGSKEVLKVVQMPVGLHDLLLCFYATAAAFAKSAGEFNLSTMAYMDDARDDLAARSRTGA